MWVFFLYDLNYFFVEAALSKLFFFLSIFPPFLIFMTKYKLQRPKWSDGEGAGAPCGVNFCYRQFTHVHVLIMLISHKLTTHSHMMIHVRKHTRTETHTDTRIYLIIQFIIRIINRVLCTIKPVHSQILQWHLCDIKLGWNDNATRLRDKIIRFNLLFHFIVIIFIVGIQKKKK